jgi:Holliday junction resolvase RusA-like endonuclease
LAFSLDGQPVPKGRPRATVRGGYARIYTPSTTRKYELAVRKIAALHMRGREPFDGPLSVSVRFRLAPPKSMSKRQRARVLAGEEAYLGASDLDNYVKAFWDSLNGVVWLDDKQIVRAFLTKAAAEVAGIDVKVTPL